MSNNTLNPTHLFISYAVEDASLASWLARKLSARGYAVWFDRMELLGGEPWPQTIDEAIKQRTFRMLALMSASSVHKPNPSKERTLALNIARARKIPDFLITLKVDDADLDWLTTDISYIPFNRGWADGWRQLIKKLESVAAPKTLTSGAVLAASTFPNAAEFVHTEPETLTANIVRVKSFPDKLRVFQAVPGLDSATRARIDELWPSFYLENGAYIGLFPPPVGLAKHLKATTEACLWNDCESFRKVHPRSIASTLLTRSLRLRLLKAGAHEHPKHPNIFYLQGNFSDDGKLRFIGYTGKKTWLKIRGKVTFYRGQGQAEVNHHHFGFRVQLARGLGRSLHVQLTPTLVFFDVAGQIISDESVGSRRRKLTKNWWNAKWLNRLRAAEEFLTKLPPLADEDLTLEPGLIGLTAPVMLAEKELLAQNDESESENEETVVDFDGTDDSHDHE